MDDERDNITPPLPPFLAAGAEHMVDDEDDDLPVLTDVVTPGRTGTNETPFAPPSAALPEGDAGERLTALVHEVVDLALDDALDMLRPELHRRLRNYLDLRLPELLAEALDDRDRRG